MITTQISDAFVENRTKSISTLSLFLITNASTQTTISPSPITIAHSRGCQFSTEPSGRRNSPIRRVYEPRVRPWNRSERYGSPSRPQAKRRAGGPPGWGGPAAGGRECLVRPGDRSGGGTGGGRTDPPV